jgi:hypothetical protein
MVKKEALSLSIEHNEPLQHNSGRGFFMMTPTLGSTSPPGMRDEPVKKVKL